MKYKITYCSRTKRFNVYIKEYWWDSYRFRGSRETMKDAELLLKEEAQREVTIKHGRI